MRCASSQGFGKTQAGEMAQWVEVIATKPGELVLILGAHVVEGEN